MMLDLTVLRGTYAVCRLPPNSPAPEWLTGNFRAVSWSGGETSVVCAERCVPGDVIAERGWRALVVRGPLAFGLTGVLASIAQPLAEAAISIFAISTYDTDYVLVKQDSLDAAVRALEAAGHRVSGDVDG
jgi:uncharacterized protein